MYSEHVWPKGRPCRLETSTLQQTVYYEMYFVGVAPKVGVLSILGVSQDVMVNTFCSSVRAGVNWYEGWMQRKDFTKILQEM